MKNRAIRFILSILCIFGMALFVNNKSNFYLIWAISGYLISLVATAWFSIKDDKLSIQEGDLLYFLVLQSPPIYFEISYLLNQVDKRQNPPLLIGLIILLNLVFVILFDRLIQQDCSQNERDKRV